MKPTPGIKISKSETLSFATTLIIGALGVADADKIISNLHLECILNPIKLVINSHFSFQLTTPNIFSFGWILILFLLFLFRIKIDYVSGITPEASNRKIEDSVSRLTTNGISMIFNSIKLKLLDFIFKDRLLFITSFSRDQIAGAIGPQGQNIPPQENYECEDTIIRISVLNDYNEEENREYRFKLSGFKIKIRTYLENSEFKYGEFEEYDFNVRDHSWLIIVSPYFFIKWYLKFHKIMILIIFEYIIVLLLFSDYIRNK